MAKAHYRARKELEIHAKYLNKGRRDQRYEQIYGTKQLMSRDTFSKFGGKHTMGSETIVEQGS